VVKKGLPMKEIKITICKAFFRTDEEFDMGKITKSEFRMDVVKKEDELSELLNTKVHSIHNFPDLTEEEKSGGITSIRKGDRVDETYGIILDVDNTDLNVGFDGKPLTIAEALEILEHMGISYVIYSSKSHQMVKKGHTNDGKQDRFHILIPFEDPIIYKDITGSKDRIFKAVFEHFNHNFNKYLDSACSDLARIIYPARSDDPEIHISFDKPFFNWRSDVKYSQSDSVINFGNVDPKQPLTDDVIFRLNRIVRLAKNNKEATIDQIHKKTTIYCPFHEDKTPSAFIDFTSQGVPFLHCSSCKQAGLGQNGTYQLDPKDRMSIQDKLKGLYAFQDALTLKYYLYDEYGGLRQGKKEDISNYVYSCTGNRVSRWNTHYVEHKYGEKFGILDAGSVFNAQKPLPALAKALKMKEKPTTLKEVQSKMPAIRVLLKHLFPEPAHLKYFLHFIAASLKRKKVDVAICLQDKGGTGKSFLMENILGEMIFGINEAFYKFGTDDLREQWSDWMLNKHLIFGDEIGISRKQDRDSIEDKLKNLITGRKFRLRRMYHDPELAKNEFNIVIATNKDNPIHLVDTDRRWSFFTPGKSHDITDKEREGGLRPWHLRANPDWKALGINNSVEGRKKAQEEAPYFALYLLGIKPDLDLLMDVIKTEARTKIVEDQRGRFVEFATRIYTRDVEWLKDHIDPENTKLKIKGFEAFDILKSRIERSLENIISDLQGKGDYITVDDAFTVFNGIYTDSFISKQALTPKLKGTGFFTDEKSYFTRNGVSKQGRVYKFVPNAV
jgi:hypothetical protein